MNLRKEEINHILELLEEIKMGPIGQAQKFMEEYERNPVRQFSRWMEEYQRSPLGQMGKQFEQYEKGPISQIQNSIEQIRNSPTAQVSRLLKENEIRQLGELGRLHLSNKAGSLDQIQMAIEQINSGPIGRYKAILESIHQVPSKTLDAINLSYTDGFLKRYREIQSALNDIALGNAYRITAPSDSEDIKSAIARIMIQRNLDLGQVEPMFKSVERYSNRRQLLSDLSKFSPEASGHLLTAAVPLVDRVLPSIPNDSKVRKIVVTTARKLDRIIEAIACEPEERFLLDDRVFEEVVAELFTREGFQVTLMQQTRDGGRDVIAEEEDFLGKRIVQVECKRYAAHRKVGDSVVRGILGAVVVEKSTSGLVVTTSDFSKPAREAARKASPVVSLKNGMQLINWLQGLRNA